MRGKKIERGINTKNVINFISLLLKTYKMKRIIFFISILLHFCAGQAQNTAFPSLEDLDRVVAEQQKYVDIREGRISDVKSKLRKTASEEERYS